MTQPSRYLLPSLPYEYDALEPHISAEIMHLHHDRHHRSYVEGANRVIEELQHAREKEDFKSIAALERSLAFNVSGHVLHSIFWQNMTPEGGRQPTGDLALAIERDFGSLDKMKRQLVESASTIMGSGWAALVWEPVLHRIGTTQFHDHQSQVTQGSVPLLVIDGWEHAYYLQYKNEKAKFFEALWNVWNWDDVALRHSLAARLDLGLHESAEGGELTEQPSLAH